MLCRWTCKIFLQVRRHFCISCYGKYVRVEHVYKKLSINVIFILTFYAHCAYNIDIGYCADCPPGRKES